MKKALILTGALVLGLTSVQAGQSNPSFTNTYDWVTVPNPLTMEDGSPFYGSDGYIAAVFVDTANQGNNVLIGVGDFCDTWGGSYTSMTGMFAAVTWENSIWLNPSETFTIYIRVFQLAPGVNADFDYAQDAYLDGRVAAKWADILLNGGTYGEYSYQETATAVGEVQDNQSTHTTSNLVWQTSNVPEPSTYAALAGLAMLAYVIVRRRQ
ncbi:putative globular PEP-CTERM protein [Opitutaceae bacterium TAV4]|uniref:putative globular PEP-CTERM protein n=1 Tax=Geminisphaera colitermitum TaxID=1148786 RepID=UPI000158CFFE|nr:putative globular PEP-CTERM protein [Geminisphaera colitermitum]RRJ97964.1 putative globular PEP-CTERM protein [Opitutaceae bacterium TAV4]RRK02512.1 putative globular PEP-CTERM protein [Opitutaceae bacterium TAV3]